MSKLSPNFARKPRRIAFAALLLIGSVAAGCSSRSGEDGNGSCPNWNSDSVATADRNDAAAALEGIQSAGGETFASLDTAATPEMRQRLLDTMGRRVFDASTDVVDAKADTGYPDCAKPAKVTLETHIAYDCLSPYPGYSAQYMYGYTDPNAEGPTAVLATFDVSMDDVQYVGARAVPNIAESPQAIQPDAVAARTACEQYAGNVFMGPILKFDIHPQESLIGS